MTNILSLYFRLNMKLSNNISCARLSLMLTTVLKQIELLQCIGIFPRKVKCDQCEHEINQCAIKSQKIVFTCDICRKEYRIRKNTVLENSRLSNRRWMLLAFSFIKPNWTYNDGKFNNFNIIWYSN